MKTIWISQTAFQKYDDVHFGKISTYFTFLTGEDNFDAWLNAVTECLSYHRLMGLISETSPRPLFLNNESRNWVRLSTKTARWMQSSMNRAIHIRPEGMGERCTYADAVMRSAKLLVQGTKSQADAKRIKEFVQLKPTDFDLPVKYVMAYADHLKLACQHLFPMTPYVALLTLLVNIQKLTKNRLPQGSPDAEGPLG
ncbi:hypothetical protein N7507_000480 [Penicillium longicatenatum]|nr:hypothetical protein N7507_000480 [Penicillium longicatenatum]